MSKKEIQQKFKDNYIEKLKAHLQELEKQGYVLAKDEVMETIYLMRFSVNKFRFEVIASLGEAYKHINLTDVYNPFKIVLDTYEFIDIIADTLTIADADDLYAYTKYEENLDEIMNEKEMQADLKNYLQVSKRLAGNIDKNIIDTPQAQGQILAGANVFYTGKDKILRITETNKYYQWNKKTDKFKLLSANDIQEILKDVAGVDVKKMEVETNMRTVYPMLVTNTSFPVIWNRQKDLQAKIKRHKKGHDKIQKIVDSFK